MQIKRDKYVLGKSQTIEILSKNYDVKADIKLSTNNNELNIGSSISGTVVDTSNIPIKNAIIKLMNDKLESLSNTRTDEKGKYVLDIIPSSNIYTILAISTGKNLNQSPSFSLVGSEHKIINFTLSDDANSKFGAISGILIDENNNSINGAVISLYSSTDLISITYSDSQGTFIFSELMPGNYKISISSLSYSSSQETISVESKKISYLKKVLNINPIISDGSISGIITDKSNTAISKATVILYKVDEKNSQIPVASTETNSSGIYSFVNVPFGYYLIKSNVSQSTTLTPSLLTPSIKITSTTKIGTYNFSSGNLLNSAKVDYTTGFVTSLGGVNDGSVTLTINVEKSGLYDLAIEYVSADFNRNLKVEVNGNDLSDVFNAPLTIGWQISDSKTLTILTTLNQGDNILKFHGDGINLAPNLLLLTIILNNTESDPSANSYAITSSYAAYDISYTKDLGYGKCLGSASDKVSPFFVTGIGGLSNGSVTIVLEVKDVAMYYMSIGYKSNSSKFNFKIDINNENDGKIYNPPVTNDNFSSYTIPIVLKDLKSSIKFYGDGKNPAPDLSEATFFLPPVTNKLINGILENDAQIDATKNFVINIGGKKNGSSNVTVKTNTAGVYDLVLSYVGTNSKLALKIDVNGIYSNTVYTLSSTKGTSIENIKTFTIPLYLNLGNNTLKFYGNGTDSAPNLNSFTMNFNKPLTPTVPKQLKVESIYKIANARVEGPATFNKKTNLITSLGGKNNGNCTITVVVKHSGEYLLRINYKNDGTFKMVINNINTNTIYNTIGSNSNTFETLINLKAGENTIKIFGNNLELAPDLGDVYLRVNYPINYLIEDTGVFFDGATLLSNSVVTPIGGNDKSFFLIDYYCREFGEYWFNFVFSSEGGPVLIHTPIDYNDFKGLIYNIPSAKTPTVPFTIKRKLAEGYNTITITGIKENYAPDFYSLDIKPAFNPNSRQTYSFTSGIVEKGAIKDFKTNSVKNIGTSLNGSVTLTVTLPSSDYYNLELIYSPLNSDSVIKLDVNKNTINSIYTLKGNKFAKYFDPKLFTMGKIQLNKGGNTLKFYSASLPLAAELYKLIISSANLSNTLPSDVSNISPSITGIYSIKDGKLENGAKPASFSPNFIEGLGGSKQDGSFTIDFTASSDDLYDLLIEYLLIDTNRNLLISINNTDTGAVYTPSKTTDLKENVSKTFVVPVFLVKGTNKIKFHGDGSNLAPSLGKIIINKAPQIMTFNILKSKISNIDILNSPSGFLTLSDTANSYISNKFNIDKEGIYYITLEYLSLDTSIITVIINDKQSLEVTLPQTIVNTVANKKAITMKVSFIKGQNTLVFSLSKNSSYKKPFLGNFTISNNEILETLNNKYVRLLNDASNQNYNILFDNSISELGGRKNGTAIFDSVYVPLNGLYDMILSYFSMEISRPLKLSVNNVPLEETFKLPVTDAAMDLMYISTFTIPINLNKGFNTIEFYGDRNSIKGPIITNISLKLSLDKPIKIYNFSVGKLKGDATFDKQTNTISNIGSKNGGEVSLDVNVSSKNIYTLNLQYISIKKPSVLLISVNNATLPITHTLPMTVSSISSLFAKINIDIPLNMGNNSLRFYGNKTNDRLTLLSFSLESKNRLPVYTNKNYYELDLVKGEFLRGVNFDRYGNIINLGGKKDGALNIKVEVLYEGKYSLIIKHDGNGYNVPLTLTLDINDTPTGIIHTLSNVDIYDAPKEYEISLNLLAGENSIRFHGDSSNPSPILISAKLIYIS